MEYALRLAALMTDPVCMLIPPCPQVTRAPPKTTWPFCLASSTASRRCATTPFG